MNNHFTRKVFLIAFAILICQMSKAQDFQGKAYYFSKTNMDMSRFGRGRQLSEQEKKQMAERFKSFSEKTYILTFNAEESIFREDEKLSSPVGGRGPSMFGRSFSAGPQYKNIKTQTFIQDQEFFGKKFLVKEKLEPYQWQILGESKKIGEYTCFKAITLRPASELNWMSTSDGFRRGGQNSEEKKDSIDTAKNDQDSSETPEEVEMIQVIAWYAPQIPVSQGPGDYWGLPGLILEVTAGDNMMLCSKIVMNPQERETIESPKKGDVVSKQEYHNLINVKMQEFRESRRRGGGGRPGGRR